jgi:hypothetical protein
MRRARRSSGVCSPEPTRAVEPRGVRSRTRSGATVAGPVHSRARPPASAQNHTTKTCVSAHIKRRSAMSVICLRIVRFAGIVSAHDGAPVHMSGQGRVEAERDAEDASGPRQADAVYSGRWKLARRDSDSEPRRPVEPAREGTRTRVSSSAPRETATLEQTPATPKPQSSSTHPLRPDRAIAQGHRDDPSTAVSLRVYKQHATD